MDTLRGPFDSDPADESVRDFAGHDADHGTDHETDGAVRELPPEAIGQDERRMQVRAYNHWASLLDEQSFPSIEALEPTELPDFAPNSVLLDFSAGIDDPVVQYLGNRLAEECTGRAADQIGTIERLSDVPPRSLLSRITDHYMQIIANQAPIGFEAEFVNYSGSAVLYRGILLPYSSDGETIDFVYGVINWKEVADAASADELLLEIDQALGDNDDGEHAKDGDAEPVEATRRNADPVTEWADSPAHESDDDYETEQGRSAGASHLASDDAHPLPDFDQYTLDDPDEDEYDEDGAELTGTAEDAAYSFASLADYIEAPTKKTIDLDAERFDPEDYRPEDYGPDEITPADATLNEEIAEPAREIAPPAPPQPPEPPEPLPQDADLRRHLASAQQLAHTAQASEDRSRQALYAAVGRAYDFSLAASEEPEEYDALIEEAGLSVQDRAPMTPVVKLVFGAEYDKTRLTEYAAVLSHAHRVGIERGTLARYLGEAEGGLKGVVNTERRQRREENGEAVEYPNEVRAALAEKLRELEALMLDALPADGPEFSLAVLRRDGEGHIAVIGEVSDDVKLVERAAKKLVG